MKYFLHFTLPFALLFSCGPDSTSSSNIKNSTVTVSDTIQLQLDSLIQLNLEKDLWAYYDFAGDLRDKSGNGHHMTGHNEIKLSYDLFENDNNALYFNGINNYALIDQGGEFSEGDFSVSFLMMSKTLQGEIFHKADLSNGQGASFGVGFDDANQDDDSTTNLIYDVSTSDNICISNVIPSTFLYARKVLYADTWYFVTITFVHGIQKLYINGQLIGTKEVDKTVIKQCSNATFNLGIWWQYDPLYFSGKMDELRIYSRPLEDNEVQYLSQTTLPSKSTK